MRKITSELNVFAVNMYNFYGATMTFKGRLQGARMVLSLTLTQYFKV